MVSCNFIQIATLKGKSCVVRTTLLTTFKGQQINWNIAGLMSSRMKLSFSIHFLGWWLTGENWLTRGQSFPRLFTSTSSESAIIQGGHVNLHCQTDSYATKVYELLKVTPPVVSYHIWEEARNEATFRISSAKITNSGFYVCRYCVKSDKYSSCSDFSNAVKIFITGQLEAVPSLSVSPSTVVTVGENITISCKSHMHPTSEFHLFKDQSLSPLAAKKKEQNEAAFLIASAIPSDGGIYRCKYCLTTEFYKLCSHYSNSTHIFLRDPSLLKPSIEAFPSKEVAAGLNVTIECQGPKKSLNASLYKSSTLIASQITGPDSNTARFCLSLVNVSDKGNYTCQYHDRTRPFVWSPPSNLLEIIVRGEDPVSLDKRIIQAGAALGSLFLVLLLLLLAFILYRKRKKGSTANEKSQPLPVKETNTPLEAEEDPSGVCYAELRHQSPNTKQAANLEGIPEACVYASVANDRARKGQ